MPLRRIARVVTTPDPEPGFIGAGHTAVPVVGSEDFAATDPFIALMDDRVEPRSEPLGGAHPHAGFETVTFVLEGTVRDRDEGVLEAGDVLWMTAGRGIIHNEDVRSSGRVRILQLWLTLPRALRWTDPSFRRIRRDAVPVRREGGVELHLYSGSSGAERSPTPTHLPVLLADVRLGAGAVLEQELPSSWNGFVYAIEGWVAAGAERATVSTGQVGWLDRPEDADGSTLRIEGGDRGARMLLYAGEPTRDPIVVHGPFVGDTRDDIVRLYAEFREGRFGRMSELAAATAPGAAPAPRS